MRVAVIAGCLVLATTPALAQSKAAIQNLNDLWAEAYNKGDAKAVAAMYTSDAYMLPAAAPMIKGTAAIEAYLREAVKSHGDLNCTTIYVKPLGPRAAREIGTCTFKSKGATPQNLAIKYAVVWEKIGRSWKLSQDIWNTDK
jgi:uncharacterized protein (TIGR02246 family)